MLQLSGFVGILVIRQHHDQYSSSFLSHTMYHFGNIPSKSVLYIFVFIFHHLPSPTHSPRPRFIFPSRALSPTPLSPLTHFLYLVSYSTIYPLPRLLHQPQFCSAKLPS